MLLSTKGSGTPTTRTNTGTGLGSRRGRRGRRGRGEGAIEIFKQLRSMSERFFKNNLFAQAKNCEQNKIIKF